MKLASVALAAALFTAGSLAQAAPLDLSSGSAGFSSTPAIGVFTDTYTFSLATASTANGSVTSVVNGAQNIDFSSITISGPSSASFTKVLSDPFETWGLSSTLLQAGSYVLTITGVNSPAGASYGGNFAVTAVPEPETLALMLAGVGVLGWVARRRRSN